MSEAYTKCPFKNKVAKAMRNDLKKVRAYYEEMGHEMTESVYD